MNKCDCPMSMRVSEPVCLCKSVCEHWEREVRGENASQCWSWDTRVSAGRGRCPPFFSPGPPLTLLLDLTVGHLHGGWCLGECIEHGEAAISQARGGGVHHCMGTRVHHVATHSCGYRRRHDGGGQRHWKTQTHIRELIPTGTSSCPRIPTFRFFVPCYQLKKQKPNFFL